MTHTNNKKLVKWLYFCKSTLFLESIVLSLKESDKLSDYDISCNKENLFVWSKRNQYQKLLKFLFFLFSFVAPYIWGLEMLILHEEWQWYMPRPGLVRLQTSESHCHWCVLYGIQKFIFFVFYFFLYLNFN